MFDQQNTQSTADLEQVNDELTRGLELCHSLINDYRSKLGTRLHDDDETGAANDDDVGDDESDLA